MIYILTFFLLFVLSLTDKRYNRIVFWCLVLYLLLLGGFRADTVGVDTAYGYKDYWNYHSSGWRIGYVEIGYVFLMDFVKWCGGGYNMLLFLCEALCVLPLAIVINRQKNINYVLALAVYYGMYLYLQSFNMIRQCIAMSFCLLSYDLFKSHKIWSIVCMCIAYLFHKSALIFLLAFVFYFINFGIFTTVVLLGVTFVLGIMLFVSQNTIQHLLSGTKYYGYVAGGGAFGFRPFAVSIVIMAVAMNVFFMFYLVVGSKTMLKSHWTKVMIAGLCVLNLTQSLILGTRLVLYFTQAQILFYPQYLKYQSKRSKIFLALLLSLYLACNFAKIFIPSWSDINPYRLFFWS